VRTQPNTFRRSPILSLSPYCDVGSWTLLALLSVFY
jgi:hypothetical protein